jgi:multiple sugar transport system permease protein
MRTEPTRSLPAAATEMTRSRTWLRFRRAAFIILLVLLAIPLVFPMWWMVASSLKSPTEIFAIPPDLFPWSLRFENYPAIFELIPFGTQYLNSVYIAVVNTVGTILVASLAGYAFARIRFPGATLIFVLLLTALLMPDEVIIIPLFVLMKDLGWLNTHLPLLIEPVFGAQAIVGTFLMRQYFLALPIELEDAGRIDGLGRFGIFRHVAMPLALPAVATLAILTFLSSWNEFLKPLIFLGGQTDLLTVPLALNTIHDRYGDPYWEIQLAATTLSVIPMIVVFVIAQRHFIQGFASVGVKG